MGTLIPAAPPPLIHEVREWGVTSCASLRQPLTPSRTVVDDGAAIGHRETQIAQAIWGSGFILGPFGTLPTVLYKPSLPRMVPGTSLM